MWKDTVIARRLGLAAPIVQGAFGSGRSAVDLVVAVSESGGLGSFGVHHLDGTGIRRVAGEIRARTQRPFALNLWMPMGDSDDPRLSDARWKAACELLRPCFEELGVPMPARPARFGPRFEEQLETVLELAPPVFSFIFGVPRPEVLERCRRAGILTVAPPPRPPRPNYWTMPESTPSSPPASKRAGTASRSSWSPRIA